MNNLDNLYNKKFQNREFEFKDSYWEAAEQLIIVDERNRRKGRYFWFFGMLIFLIAGGVLSWIGLKNAGKIETQSAILESMSQKQISVARSPEQNINPQAEINSTTKNDAELNIARSNSETPFNQAGLPLKNSNQRLEKNDSGFSKSGVPSKALNQIIEPENVIQSIPQSVHQNETVLNKNMGNPTTENPVENAEKPEVSIVSGLAPIATIWNEIETPGYPELKKQATPKNNPFSFGLTASALIYPAKNDEKRWIGASFGVVGEYNLLNYLSLNAELLYTLRSGTFGTTSGTIQTIYSFGKKTIEYSLYPENLHFLEVPVYVQYKTGKHGIEGGLTFSYLAGIRGNIEKQTSLFPWERTGEDDFSRENQSAGWVAKDDFNSFNASLLLGYRYYLSQKIAIGLRSNYRFGELLKNTENQEQAFPESGPLHFNISANWYFLK